MGPWVNPVVVVKKKNGKDRLCIDCRKLNFVTRIRNTILSRLGNAKYISSIDLQDAFWQIPLNVDSRPKTSFNVPGYDSFQFKVVPFG